VRQLFWVEDNEREGERQYENLLARPQEGRHSEEGVRDSCACDGVDLALSVPRRASIHSEDDEEEEGLLLLLLLLLKDGD